MKKQNEIQIGGEHYQRGEGVQMWDVLERDRVTYIEGQAIKYIYRHRFKNGKEDLLKAKHCVEKLLETYYADDEVSDENKKDKI